VRDEDINRLPQAAWLAANAAAEALPQALIGPFFVALGEELRGADEVTLDGGIDEFIARAVAAVTRRLQ
jgi:hypothetical protein